MGYPNTFIAVAKDCPTIRGVPLERSSGRAAASTQYATLAATPGRWTQEDVRFASSPQLPAGTSVVARCLGASARSPSPSPAPA
ncbi:MAG: DUF6157 family protein [Mycobacteriales bacterium]